MQLLVSPDIYAFELVFGLEDLDGSCDPCDLSNPSLKLAKKPFSEEDSLTFVRASWKLLKEALNLSDDDLRFFSADSLSFSEEFSSFKIIGSKIFFLVLTLILIFR